MKYHYLRLFLLEKQRPGLFEAAEMLPEIESRQEYLRRHFRSRIDFEHRNKTMVYIPIGQEDVEGGHILFGRIGRSVVSIENAPPEEQFAETMHKGWRAANILVDTRNHTDGQKVAFQRHPNVGKPLSIFSSLVDHINSIDPDSGWLMEVNLIIEKQSFWDAVQANKGEITTAEFRFVTPNILGIRSKLNEELKKRRANNNATEVSETLYNKDGNLILEGEEVEETVDYISEGGGKAKLKKGKEILYDSEQEEKTVDVDDDEPLSAANTSTWGRIRGIIFR